MDIKLTKKHVLTVLGLLGVFAMQPLAATPVTFRVNMEYQTSIGQFVPGGTVEARGSFNNWGSSPKLILTNVPSTAIYQNTIEISSDPGTTIYYKFWNNGAGSADNWESGSDRNFVLSAQPQTVYRYFNDVWAGGDPVPVTFQVNMLPQIMNRTFNPLSDFVEARGSFQDAPSWSAPGLQLTNSPTATNIYSGTYNVSSVPPGGLIQYKFVIVTNGAFGQDRWEGDPNRSFPMPTEPATVPLDTFNRESATGIQVRFEVDVGYAPNFDPQVDSVEVRGSFQVPNQWSGGFALTNDPARPYVYTGVYETFRAPGTYFEYKFVILDNDQMPVATRWELDPNRNFTLASTNQTLPLAVFNRVVVSDLLPVDTWVTFQVSMTNATGFGGQPVFDPDFYTLYINGAFIPWWDWNQAAPSQYQMIRMGDSLVYTNSYLLPKGSLARVVYKYGINGVDNEAAVGSDHIRYVRSTSGSYTMPLDQFGNMVQEVAFGNLTIAKPQGGSATISWLGHPGVRLQSSSSPAGPWVDVNGTLGASQASIQTGSGTQFFRLYKP